MHVLGCTETLKFTCIYQVVIRFAAFINLPEPLLAQLLHSPLQAAVSAEAAFWTTELCQEKGKKNVHTWSNFDVCL
jgi:hypothetical protein